MITATSMLYLYVETPLHAGAGSGLSSIDLPIQRERTTQYPMIQGSGIKGKLRATAEDTIKGSLSGVFAYTTSCDVLARFKRDFERGQTENNLPWNVPAKPVANNALVTTTSEVQAYKTLVLEEFSFDAQVEPQVDSIAGWLVEHALPDLNAGDYWSNKVKNALVILPENDFRDFALYATEVITRVRIDRTTKTVESGALWTEEYLPTDTLLYVPIYATNARKNGKDGIRLSGKEILDAVKPLGAGKGSYLQLGGDETVGRGIVRIRWED